MNREHLLDVTGAANIVRYALAAVLAIFALIQLNDPDPAIWVLAYGLAAASLAVPQSRPMASRLAWLAGGVLLTLACLSAPGFFDYLASGDPGSISGEMSAETPYIEEARELIGILLAGACVVAVRWLATRGSGT